MKTILFSLLLLLAQQINTGNFRRVAAPPTTSVSAWPMNEGSGLTLHDISGHNNTATISAAGAVTWQANAGLPGITPLWSGTGNAVASNVALTNFDGTAPFSVSAWINFPGGLPASTFVGNLNASNNFQGWELSTINASDQYDGLTFYLINSYPTNAINVTQAFNNPLTVGLHYVVATYDGSQHAAGVNLYMDGVLQVIDIPPNPDTLTASSASGLPVTFGSRSDGSQELAMPMAFVEIYSSVLTQAQISSNFAAGPGIH